MNKILPQNYRKITAKTKTHFSKHSNKYFNFAVGLEILLFIVLISFCIFLFLEYKNAQRKRVEELRELVFWEQQSTRFPNYPEAYYNTAIHALRLGDKQKALEYLDKSLEVNPDFEPSKNLKNEL